MAVKIKALQSIAGNEYGKLRPGDVGYCKPSTAKSLVERNLAVIIAEDVEASVKEIKPFITMENYQPKEESKPVLYGEPSHEIKVEKKDFRPDPPSADDIVKDEPEQAATKKQYEDEKEKKEVKETPKKHYK